MCQATQRNNNMVKWSSSVALLNDTFFETEFCMIVMITLADSNESDDLDSESEDHEIVNCCIQLIITVSNIYNMINIINFDMI